MDHSQWLEKNKQKQKVQCLYNSAKEKGIMLLLLFVFFAGLYFINIAITFDRNYAVKVVTTVDMLSIMMIMTMSRNATTSLECFKVYNECFS